MVIKLMVDKIQWDQFVDQSPYGLLYHKWDFLKLIEKYTNYKLLPYSIYKGEQLACIFPMFYKKVLGLKFLFSPPPQSGVPYLGYVLSREYDCLKQTAKETILNLLAAEISDEMKKLAPNYFSAFLVPGLMDVRHFKWLNFGVNISYTYKIDLNQELKDIWANFNSNCRQNIRKGEDLKCKVKISEDTSVLTDLLKDRYNEQGMNYLINPDYLKELINTYPDNLGLYCLYDNNKIIGGTLNHKYKWYLGWIGLVKAKDKKYKYVNEYMIWKFIEEAKELGFSKFEISGANKQKLCQYRSKFNPKLETCLELYKNDIIGKAAEGIYLNFFKKI
ncbi:MAG: hypothetical protein APF76_12255 [Desulfitibacter sp. BRH_c19]|nr:MAG: hypothetical protein APF76_12255 [Desulfitibacter sp. BRH_c19]